MGRISRYWVIFSIKLPLVPLTVAVTVTNPVPPSRVAMIGLVTADFLKNFFPCAIQKNGAYALRTPR
jgi:hypothetical protein